MNLLNFLTELRPYYPSSTREAFSISNVSIAWYALIIVTGAIIVAIYGYYRQAKPLGLNSDVVFTGFVLGLFCGILGARLYYVIFTASTGEIQYDGLWDILNPRDGGLAIHGGLIGSAIAVIIYCGIKHVKLLELFEIVMPLILFAQAVGRWGNFINQEAFGGLVQVEGLANIKDLSFRTYLSDEILIAQREALSRLWIPDFVIDRMYITSSSADGFICPGYYYPTFYFESVANFIGVTLYMIARKYIKAIKVGDGISFYLIWYGVVRFFIETMRTDPLIIGNTGIKVAELISIVCIVVGVLFIVLRRVFKYKMISCKEFFYSGNCTIVKDGYSYPKEPFFLTAIINKFKKKNKDEQQDEEQDNNI